jgi:hypothetical protein
MNAPGLASALLPQYLGTGLVLAVAALAYLGLIAAVTRVGGSAPERAPGPWIRWGWALLAAALLLPAVGRWARPAGGGPVEIWRGRAARNDWAPVPIHLGVRFTAAAAAVPTSAAPARWTLGAAAQMTALGALGAGVAGAALLWSLRARRLRRFCRALPVARRVGRVRLAVAPEGTIPFAARTGGLAYVVVPLPLLADPARLRLVIAHEAQHHRHGDLLAAGLFAWLRVPFFWVPALGRWERAIARLQDLACDRAVLRRRWVSAQAYGRCLLWAAGAADPAAHSGVTPALVRGMGPAPAETLRRRILMLKDGQREQTGGRRGRWAVGLLGLTAVAAVAGSAWAVQAAVADHAVSRAQVAELAGRIQRRSGFPVLTDDRIVSELNRRLANPDWRDEVRKALGRMPNYRAMIEDTLRRNNLPIELSAMVLAESGFDNEARPNRPPEVQSAGVWQITPGTARKLGLTVSPALDERLEPRRATEAAAHFLSELHAAFGGDWALAIAAYNGGKGGVKAAIGNSTGAEARARVLASPREFGQYLASVTIALLIIEQPSLLD